MTDTVAALSDAATAFLNEGLGKLPLERQVEIGAAHDAGTAKVMVICDFGRAYFSAVIVPTDGPTRELFGAYRTAEPATKTMN
jgi:hypothetical protein